MLTEGSKTEDDLKSLIKAELSMREHIVVRIERLEVELERRDRLIDSLKKSLATLDPNGPQQRAVKIPSLIGSTIVECAFTILKRSSGSMPYQEIYKLATENGYVSGASSTKLAKRSFATAMKRAPDIFERHGSREFSLKNEFKHLDSLPAPKKKRSRRRNDTLSKMRDCLERYGPCSASEIADRTGLNKGSLSSYLCEPTFQRHPVRGVWGLPSVK